MFNHVLTAMRYLVMLPNFVIRVCAAPGKGPQVSFHNAGRYLLNLRKGRLHEFTLTHDLAQLLNKPTSCR